MILKGVGMFTGNKMVKISIFRFLSLILALILAFVFSVSSFATAGSYSKSAIEEARAEIVENIIEIAKAEIGFYENEINKFTNWYYGRETNASWCCIFVSWCAAQAGVIETAIPQRSSCQSMRTWFKLRGEYYPIESGYVPQKGDIVFYNVDVDGTDNVNHVEIVTEDGFIISNNTVGVKSVGGNTSNLKYQGDQYVMEKIRPVDGPRAQIVGFCHPSYEKSLGIIGKIYTFNDSIRNDDMRFIHSKYISLMYRIENFWYEILHMFDNNIFDLII